MPPCTFCPGIYCLNLKEILLLPLAEKSMILLLSTAGSSLWYYHKLPDVFEYALLYSIKLYMGIYYFIILSTI